MKLTVPGRTETANFLYFSGLAVLIASLPLSKFTMSVSQMMLGMAWLLMGDYKNRIKLFLNNKVAIAIVSIYLLHLIGLFYTSNFNYALKDLRVKLPLFILPFMFASFPRLTGKQINLYIYLFSAAIIAGTFISFYRYVSGNVSDYRDLSPFISHIRFSLLVCLSAFLMYYQAWEEKNFRLRILQLASAIWLSFMLFILQSATSLIIFFATAFIVVFYLGMIKIPRKLQVLLLFIVIIPVSYGIYFTIATFNDFTNVAPYDVTKLDKVTASGNKYTHDTSQYWIENGRQGGLYLCKKELRAEWNRRSRINFDSTDVHGQYIQYTLIRYLTSLDLRKDSAGVASLSNEDIKNIESGIANHDYLTDSRLKTALNKIVLGYYQYRWKSGTRGSSLMQRIELWETSLQIIKKKPWFGTGTGDIPDEFSSQLKQNKSELAGTGLRSHNQFLSITVALGIFGLVWFLAVLLFIITYRKKWLDYRVLVSFSIIFLSMFNEDTIETQAGVTFFTFFLSFFMILPLQQSSSVPSAVSQKTEPN